MSVQAESRQRRVATDPLDLTREHNLTSVDTSVRRKDNFVPSVSNTSSRSNEDHRGVLQDLWCYT